MTRHGYQGACENKEQSARGDSGNCAKSGPISPTLALQCDDDQAIVDQHGLTHADMVPILGTPSRVSEVLRGRKGLIMAMVQRLRTRFSRAGQPSHSAAQAHGQPRHHDQAQEDAQPGNIIWIERSLIPYPNDRGLAFSGRWACAGQYYAGSLDACLEHAELTVESRHAPRLHHEASQG
jgi:hypothetical protein